MVVLEVQFWYAVIGWKALQTGAIVPR